MKEGKAIRDIQVKAIKTVLKESNVRFIDLNMVYSELKNAIIKIVNVRKYENIFGNAYSYEVDVVVDMKNKDSFFYSNRYCERYKVRCNGYYRRKIANALEHEFKYFGFDIDRDELVVKKITYKEIV
jgi:hypothetical protein